MGYPCFFFRKTAILPKRNNYIQTESGKAMFAERKVLSLESAGLSKKAKRRE